MVSFFSSVKTEKMFFSSCHERGTKKKILRPHEESNLQNQTFGFIGASERGIRRSEVRFLMGTQNFVFLCPTLVTRRKRTSFLHFTYLSKDNVFRSLK